MIQTLKKLLMNLSIISLFAVPLAMPAMVRAADIQTPLCEGANLQIGSTEGCEPNGTAANRINEVITNVINIFSIVVGVVAVIMIIIGGLKYIMSGGDSGNITGAKNTILYAIIGLVVVALAQIIVKFVIGRVGQ